MRRKELVILFIILLLVTCLTLYFVFTGVLISPLSDILIVIEGTMIAELTLLKLADLFKKPRIIIKPKSKMFDVGFLVKVKNKHIRDAKFYCDNTHIKWKEQDGTEKETKNLRVGGTAYLYPFKIFLSEAKLSRFADPKIQSVEITIKQQMVDYGENYTKKYERTIYSESFTIPKGKFGTIKIKEDYHFFPQFYCNIRITGEGIEDEIDSWFKFTCDFYFSRYADSELIEDLSISCDFGEAELWV